MKRKREFKINTGEDKVSLILRKETTSGLLTLDEFNRDFEKLSNEIFESLMEEYNASSISIK